MIVHSEGRSSVFEGDKEVEVDIIKNDRSELLARVIGGRLKEGI